MITIDEIRKYNIPDAIPEQHIQEHLSGIPETTEDKLNARSFTRDEVRELAMNEERKAAEFIQLILAEADAVDGIKTVGKYTFASIGGNPDYKTEKTRLR
jgi:hypothetical protein